LSEGFRSVWKNYWSEAEKIFLETQKDFFEYKWDLYFCKLKTTKRSGIKKSIKTGLFDDKIKKKTNSDLFVHLNFTIILRLIFCKMNILAQIIYRNMNEINLNEEPEIIDDTINENEEFRYSITSYGADYTIDSIVQRIEKEKIYVPPFQRKYVWNQVQASRFIESLILGLPVPGVFLSKEEETGRLLIIDGQQRMLSVANFYKGLFGEKKFRLKNVQEDLEGKTYDDLKEVDRNRLDDSILHATIIKQDGPDDDDSSIYMVFERLNTGGTILQPQEIRACVYYGAFNELLNELTQNEYWKVLFEKDSKRMKEQELILRFFALYYEYPEFKKILKTFLNSFMKRNKNLEVYSKETLTDLFVSTIKFIIDNLGNNAFKNGNRVNAALFDAVMIGIAKRITSKGSDLNGELFKIKYQELIDDHQFISYTQSNTSNEASVKGRIDLAIDKFSDL